MHVYRLSILCFLIISSVKVFGQWEPCGNGLPLGHFAFDLVTVGNELLIATDNQIYRSGILGDNWSPSSAGLPSSDSAMYSLMVHGSRVFAGADSAIYYSDDNGISWSLSWVTDSRVLEFAEDSSALYVVTRTAGCLKSIDNGQSWNAANNGLQTDSLTDILAVGNRLFVGSQRFGLYVSEDAGNSWLALPVIQDPFNIQEIVYNGSDIFIGLRHWPHGNHYIMRSPDWGSSWTQINSPTFYQGWSVLANTGIAVGSAVLFAGEQVYRGSDYGVSWENYSQGSSFPYNSFHSTDDYIFLASGDYFSPELLYRRPLSQVLGVDNSVIEESRIELYPNPASEQLEVKFPLTNSSIIQVTIADVLGEVVLTKRVNNTPSLKIEVANLESGSYTVSLIKEDGTGYNQRLIVQH